MYYVTTFTVYQFNHSFTLFCSYQAPHFDWRLLLVILDSFTCNYNFFEKTPIAQLLGYSWICRNCINQDTSLQKFLFDSQLLRHMYTQCRYPFHTYTRDGEKLYLTHWYGVNEATIYFGWTPPCAEYFGFTTYLDNQYVNKES